MARSTRQKLLYYRMFWRYYRGPRHWVSFAATTYRLVRFAFSQDNIEELLSAEVQLNHRAIVATVVDQLRLGRHLGVSREAFVKEFHERDIPEEIPVAVFDHLQVIGASKKFSVSFDDSYDKVFHMIHDDIDDDAERLVREFGMELPIEPILHEWQKPLETLPDMVLWLDWVRQHHSPIGCQSRFGKFPTGTLSD